MKQFMPSVELIRAIRQQYRLAWNGLHGAGHWARVLENGLRLAKTTGANQKVITHFAVFHDACRHNDDYDPLHGVRGAALAAQLRPLLPEVDEYEFTLLQTACTHHTVGRSHPNITVKTCWDSDRLDLMRVGIQPNPRFLCTDAAKQTETIEWAVERNCRGYIPAFAIEEWGCQTASVFL